MLDHEDLKWIATTSTELNSMLQQISRYSDLARRHKGEYNYVEMLGERVELAAKTAQALFDHVTSNIMQGSAKSAPTRKISTPSFSVMPPPDLSPPASSAPSPTRSAQPAAALRSVPTAAQAAPAPRPPAPALPDFQTLNPGGNRELILLVDDEMEISQIASTMLTDEGYKVILAKDGFEALKIYKHLSGEIGLVILDFFLPIMDGDAVFDELRAINPNISVVLSSGFAEQSKVGAMLAQGLRGFIPKPYTREKLLEQVRSTLDASRQQNR